MKSFDKLKEKIDELNKKKKEFEKQIQEEGSVLFKEICQELFDSFPEVDSFSWTQYTPYWNDGEECHFRINEVSEINGYDQYGDSDGGEGFNAFEKYSWNENESDPRSWEIVKTIRTFFESIPDEILENVYGNHVKVTVYRDKPVLVLEYEHE